MDIEIGSITSKMGFALSAFKVFMYIWLFFLLIFMTKVNWDTSNRNKDLQDVNNIVERIENGTVNQLVSQLLNATHW